MTNQYVKFLQGHVLDVLRDLPDESVQCCLTSPPYFGLRDYGTDPVEWDRVAFRPMPGLDKIKVKQQTASLGNEKDLWSYVGHLIQIFREVKRILRPDGTFYLNLGDSYFGGGYANHKINGEEWKEQHGGEQYQSRQQDRIRANLDLKPKDLIGIPWRVAFALQADGWILRQDIIWAKAVSFNPVYCGQTMPESTRDRCTKAHEYLFHFAKSPKYFYDIDAIKEPSRHANETHTARGKYLDKDDKPIKGHDTHVVGIRQITETRNPRSVWTINPHPFAEAHFAVWPETLVEPIIKSATSEKGCCAACGAPLEHLVEQQTYRELAPEKETKKTPLKVVRAGWRDPENRRKVTKDIWQRTCDCDVNKTKPCVVLDPFGGGRYHRDGGGALTTTLHLD